MPHFEVAHIREQGVDLIIIPLAHEFSLKSPQEQIEVTATLQTCASAAGLAGTVVPVWDSGGGRMAFLAPPNWHAFFKSINLQFVQLNINRKMYCS